MASMNCNLEKYQLVSWLTQNSNTVFKRNNLHDVWTQADKVSVKGRLVTEIALSRGSCLFKKMLSDILQIEQYYRLRALPQLLQTWKLPQSAIPKNGQLISKPSPQCDVNCNDVRDVKIFEPFPNRSER